jgi:hypothetical protein
VSASTAPGCRRVVSSKLALILSRSESGQRTIDIIERLAGAVGVVISLKRETTVSKHRPSYGVCSPF